MCISISFCLKQVITPENGTGILSSFYLWSDTRNLLDSATRDTFVASERLNQWNKQHTVIVTRIATSEPFIVAVDFLSYVWFTAVPSLLVTYA